MNISVWILVFISLAEIGLLFLLLVFFMRLRRSESLLNTLQGKQEKLLARMHFNAELEQELMQSFEERQRELRALDARLEERAEGLRKLLEQAEGISRSPQFLREVILNGQRKGQTVRQLAQHTGLSVEEVELILMKSGS